MKKVGMHLNWNMIWEIISKYWVQQLCVLALGILTAVYNRRIKRYAQDQKAIRKAMTALLRDRFYEGYRRYMR